MTAIIGEHHCRKACLSQRCSILHAVELTGQRRPVVLQSTLESPLIYNHWFVLVVSGGIGFREKLLAHDRRRSNHKAGYSERARRNSHYSHELLNLLMYDCIFSVLIGSAYSGF